MDRFPCIDLGSGGSVVGFVKNIERMVEDVPDDYRIVPGHGPLATKDDLKAFQAMLLETTGIVKKGIEQGKTVNQIKAAGFPAKYMDWGSGFINTDRRIDIVYNGLASQ